MNLLKRWLVFMLALFVAAWLIPGIHVESNAWVVYAIMAAILALLNAILLPILKTLSCGLIILTLGLFSLVLNAVMFMLSSYLAQTWFNVGYIVDDFWSALLGSLIVSVVSMLFSSDKKKKRDED
ncbi:MAG TPA: phage holin family protein [Anaerolineaceae bacterium]|jgi:putative membrane protein|nr:phage holin family protein [Anaerolineaceae bacterium]